MAKMAKVLAKKKVAKVAKTKVEKVAKFLTKRWRKKKEEGMILVLLILMQN